MKIRQEGLVGGSQGGAEVKCPLCRAEINHSVRILHVTTGAIGATNSLFSRLKSFEGKVGREKHRGHQKCLTQEENKKCCISPLGNKLVYLHAGACHSKALWP